MLQVAADTTELGEGASNQEVPQKDEVPQAMEVEEEMGAVATSSSSSSSADQADATIQAANFAPAADAEVLEAEPNHVDEADLAAPVSHPAHILPVPSIARDADISLDGQSVQVPPDPMPQAPMASVDSPAVQAAVAEPETLAAASKEAVLDRRRAGRVPDRQERAPWSTARGSRRDRNCVPDRARDCDRDRDRARDCDRDRDRARDCDRDRDRARDCDRDRDEARDLAVHDRRREGPRMPARLSAVGSMSMALHPRFGFDAPPRKELFEAFADDDAIGLGGEGDLALDAASSAAAAAAYQPEPEVIDEVLSSGSLTISTRIEYSSIPQNRQQNVFGIVTVQAAPAKLQGGMEEQHRPMDIICVLDVSGSMSGTKIRLVQDAVRFVIGESHKQDRVSIVTFNSQAQRVLKMRRMDEAGKDDAMQATLRLAAGGGTNIASGLEAALEVAERRRQRNSVSAILLLTDGKDGSSDRALAALISRGKRAGCAIYPFGFGSDHDARLLSNLAELAETPFSYVEDVEQIGAAFAGALGGLATVSAQRVEIMLQSHADLTAVHTPFTVTREGNSARIQIPDILAGERRDVLVELLVPEAASAEQTALLDASAQYWDLEAEAQVQTPTVQMQAERVLDEAQPEQEPDEEVSVQRHRVQVAQTLQAAADQGEGGKFTEAQEMLDAHCHRLRQENRTKSKVTEGLAVELEDARSRMRSRSSWEAGGRAEVLDAWNMHSKQRATNLCPSSLSMEKRSKAMYVTCAQEAYIDRCRK